MFHVFEGLPKPLPPEPCALPPLPMIAKWQIGKRAVRIVDGKICSKMASRIKQTLWRLSSHSRTSDDTQVRGIDLEHGFENLTLPGGLEPCRAGLGPCHYNVHGASCGIIPLPWYDAEHMDTIVNADTTLTRQST
jgi:hypothetical protein